MYYRYKSNVLGPFFPKLLSALRFLSVFIISFLLIGPLIKTSIKQTKKPIIIVAQDNSGSISLGYDSLSLSEYSEQLKSLIDKLSDEFNVKTIAFGSEIIDGPDFQFSDKTTNFNQLFENIDKRYSNRNVGSLIIATDGLYNDGVNPYYLASNVSYPIFTIALGDTTIKKDVAVERIYHNDVVFAGDRFIAEINIQALAAKDERIILSVLKNDSTIYYQEFKVKKGNQVFRKELELPAIGTGKQRYRVKLKGLENEENLHNNSRDFYISIIESKQNVLIAAAAPHPDISSVFNALTVNKNLNVKVQYLDKQFDSIGIYNLVILHQIPSKNNKWSEQFYRDLIRSDIPVLLVTGTDTDFNEFNRLQTGLNIYSDNKSTEFSFPLFNRSFSFFTLPEELTLLLEKLPPLNTVIGTYQMSPSSQVLFYQKINGIETDYPLFSFSDLQNKKLGFISGTGIWRWQLSDYLENSNHLAFNSLINKIVQYLTIQSDNRYFRVKAKDTYDANEKLIFEAELYNENYELINFPEVNLVIMNEDGQEYQYTFRKEGKSYRINTGIFPEGKYAYSATTETGGNKYTDRGEFLIKGINIESMSTVAEHNLLRRISGMKDAKLVYPDSLLSIPDYLNDRDDIYTLTYYDNDFLPLINLFWIFGIIMLLLAVEWFLRKWLGIY